MEVSEWKEMIQKERELKYMFFLSNSNSPISFEERLQLKGLDYFPLDPGYRFVITHHEYEEKKILKVLDTKGDEREFLRWGEFRFKIEEKKCTLQAYNGDPDEDRLFVPFRDKNQRYRNIRSGAIYRYQL
jgi:uncharacterized protein